MSVRKIKKRHYSRFCVLKFCGAEMLAIKLKSGKGHFFFCKLFGGLGLC